MGKIKLALRGAILKIAPMVSLLALTWIVWYGFEIATIQKAVDGPTTSWEQRTLNGFDQTAAFRETGWDDEDYDQHLEEGLQAAETEQIEVEQVETEEVIPETVETEQVETETVEHERVLHEEVLTEKILASEPSGGSHVKTGWFAGIRSFVSQLHEAFWLYVLGLAKTGRNPLVIHRLISRWYLLIGGIILLVAWMILALRTEKYVDAWVNRNTLPKRGRASQFFQICRLSVVATIVQIVVALVLGVAVLWPQVLDAVDLIWVTLGVFAITTIVQLFKLGSVNASVESPRAARRRAQREQSGRYTPPLPGNFVQTLKRALGLRWWKE